MFLASGAVPGWAQPGKHAYHDAKALDAGKALRTVERPEIPDVRLKNQNGEIVRFHTDLVKGRVVAINTIFTTCTTICPIMGVHYAKLQKEEEIRARLGRELVLISISVDPVTDTAERLKLWSAKLGAQPGWTLLTGEKQDVVQLLKALDVFTPDKESHSPVMLIGRDTEREWMRLDGLAPVSELANQIGAFLAGATGEP